jgi:hypothetical protein
VPIGSLDRVWTIFFSLIFYWFVVGPLAYAAFNRRSTMRAITDAPTGSTSGSRKKLGLCRPVVPE